MLNPECRVLVSNLASACAPVQIQMIQAPLLGPDLEMFHPSFPIMIFNTDPYVLRVLESADRSRKQTQHAFTNIHKLLVDLGKRATERERFDFF